MLLASRGFSNGPREWDQLEERTFESAAVVLSNNLAQHDWSLNPALHKMTHFSKALVYTHKTLLFTQKLLESART